MPLGFLEGPAGNSPGSLPIPRRPAECARRALEPLASGTGGAYVPLHSFEVSKIQFFSRMTSALPKLKLDLIHHLLPSPGSGLAKQPCRWDTRDYPRVPGTSANRSLCSA